jgi:hypothetical protein
MKTDERNDMQDFQQRQPRGKCLARTGDDRPMVIPKSRTALVKKPAPPSTVQFVQLFMAFPGF